MCACLGQVYDYDASGKHTLLGEVEASTATLLSIAGRVATTAQGLLQTCPAGTVSPTCCSPHLPHCVDSELTEWAVLPLRLNLRGSLFTTLAADSTARTCATAGSEPLQLVDVKFKGNGRKHAGVLHIKTMTVSQRPTFLDYVQAGAEINFICGIDFTASNKDPRDPESLHYLSQTGGLLGLCWSMATQRARARALS